MALRIGQRLLTYPAGDLLSAQKGPEAHLGFFVGT